MVFKVTISTEGAAIITSIATTRVDAKDQLMTAVRSLVDEGYMPEPSTTVNDVFRVVLRKQDAPTCIVSAFNASSVDDPLTGKFKQLLLLMSKLNPEKVAIDVEVLISTLMANSLDPKEPMLPGVPLGELINTSGFYTDDTIVQHLVGNYIGRICNAAAVACRVNISDPDELTKIVPIIDKLCLVERQVVPIVKQRMIKKYGIPPDFDQVKVNDLIDKINTCISGIS